VSRALEALTAGARRILGQPLSEAELAAFDKYLKLLQKWQQSQRLVGSTDPDWIVEHLFLDSLLFLRVLPPGTASIADLGSGAGFPGIPIKIVRPEIEVALIESRERRVSFLATTVRELGLQRIRVVNARAERSAQQMPAAFAAAVMRCAGNPIHIMPIAAKLVAPGGVVIASGPPVRRPLRIGIWVEVPGIGPADTRRFVVYHV
jgi:16S rRNA (guanine527-N7)-methyltransferase